MQTDEIFTCLFDETELFTFQIVIENLDSRKIQYMKYELCIEAENPPIYECRIIIIFYIYNKYK